jgi:small ligand-binding sensory domain FIST
MAKPEKDELMLGIQKELNDLGIKNMYKRMVFYDHKRKREGWVHQIMVTGLICRAMYITFVPDPPEMHVTDRMYFEYSTKDWHMVLADPKSNPQMIVNLFKDLKAVGDKYGRSPQP